MVRRRSSVRIRCQALCRRGATVAYYLAKVMVAGSSPVVCSTRGWLELADTHGSDPCGRKVVRVRVPLRALGDPVNVALPRQPQSGHSLEGSHSWLIALPC